MITVLTADPYAAYDNVPILVKTRISIIITPVSTNLKFSGLFMDSCIGIIRPIPSNANAAVPKNNTKSFLLNNVISATPFVASVNISK